VNRGRHNRANDSSTRQRGPREATTRPDCHPAAVDEETRRRDFRSRQARLAAPEEDGTRPIRPARRDVSAHSTGGAVEHGSGSSTDGRKTTREVCGVTRGSPRYRRLTAEEVPLNEIVWPAAWRAAATAIDNSGPTSGLRRGADQCPHGFASGPALDENSRTREPRFEKASLVAFDAGGRPLCSARFLSAPFHSKPCAWYRPAAFLDESRTFPQSFGSSRLKVRRREIGRERRERKIMLRPVA